MNEITAMNTHTSFKGIGNINKAETGKVMLWTDELVNHPDIIKGKIIYNKGESPLYRMAFLIDSGVKAVIFENGGKNYHPLILLSDALVPAVAGIGNVDLENKQVTVDAKNGIVYLNKIHFAKKIKTLKIKSCNTKVYVNVGYPTALKKAFETGAEGIGLFRTEFTAVQTLSKLLDKKISGDRTVKQEIENSNEADALYKLIKHPLFRSNFKNDFKKTILKAYDCFGEKEIIFRSFDIARNENDQMGNRGIRRCLSEGGGSLNLLAEAIYEVMNEEKQRKWNIGFILPLVSHYSQIRSALNIFLKSGLILKTDKSKSGPSVKFGWEIEQPSASQNNELWLGSYLKEFKYPPHFIGIGTNDLTQFTIALERDAYAKEKDPKVKKYLMDLYNENDFSIVKQIYETSKQCANAGVKLFLLGEAAARQPFSQLVLAFGIIPSVSIESVEKVKSVAYQFENNSSRKLVIRDFINNTTKIYPSKVRPFIKCKLKEYFDSDNCI